MHNVIYPYIIGPIILCIIGLIMYPARVSIRIHVLVSRYRNVQHSLPLDRVAEWQSDRVTDRERLLVMPPGGSANFSDSIQNQALFRRTFQLFVWLFFSLGDLGKFSLKTTLFYVENGSGIFRNSLEYIFKSFQTWNRFQKVVFWVPKLNFQCFGRPCLYLVKK